MNVYSGAQRRRLDMSKAIVMLAIAMFTTAATAEEGKTVVRDDERGTLSLVIENDVLAGSDRNYTNGVRVSWLSGTRESSGFAQKISGPGSNAKVRHGFALGQSIFTPNNLDAERRLPDQHPYAGWLYGEYSWLIQQRDIIDHFTLQAGIVGPSAGAEWAQNEFHSIIDSEKANGWDNQIDDEAGVGVSYDRKLRALANFGIGGMSVDITPSFGLSLGNIYTNARVGLMVRIGNDLRNDFSPPRIRPSLSGAGFFDPRDGASWYFFAGAEARGVAHNIFLDGSLFRKDEVDLSSKDVVADFQAGFVVQLHNVQFSLTYVERSDEFEEQVEPQQFAALSLSLKL